MRWFVGFLTCLLLAALSLSFTGSQEAPALLSDNDLMSVFLDPGSEWRGKPFWSWNGKLDKDELIRQVGVFKEMGFGGYFMHSRICLDTEYLGDEWFTLVNAVSDEGVRQGMVNYLYDEDRWPSGTAGGYVTMDPRFRQHFLHMEVLPKDSSLMLPDTLAAMFTCKLEGTSFSNPVRVYSREEAISSPGNSVLAFYVRESPHDNVYNGFTFLDTFNPKATGRFIELTHDAYLRSCGGRIGRDISGIFTDEPYRGTLFAHDGNSRKIPWTTNMPRAYARRFGGDLLEDLPSIFLHRDGNTYDKAKWQYVELAQELFLKNFVKPQHDWCVRHGMDYTGHYLHEDNLTSQVLNQGSLMRAYELQDIPGIDALTQFNRDYWIAVQVRSVARQTGRRHILSELYGCSGWQMSFEDYKEAGDWQALFGVNLRCPHLSWYTMKGEAKRDYPASISFQSSWYRDFKYVEDYYARLGFLLAQGDPVCDLLVVSPIESVFAQASVDSFYPMYYTPASEPMKTIEQGYVDLFNWIEGTHVDFDYGDEDIISRLGKVKRAKEGPVLQIGKASYKAVFVGNMATIRSSTLSILKKFAQAGGIVILGGDAPAMVDVVQSDEPGHFFSVNALCVPYEQEAVEKAVVKSVGRMADISDAEGKELQSVFCQVRRDGDRQICVFMNMTGSDICGVSLDIGTDGYLSEWDARSGKVTDLGKLDGLVRRDFAPWQEYVFVISQGPIGHQAVKVPVSAEDYRPLTLPEKVTYSLDEPNVLPLDLAYWKADDMEWNGLEEVLKIDSAIRSHYGLELRGGNMLQPWFFHKFFGSNKPVFGSVELRFPFLIEHIPEGGMTLCMEEPGDFEIIINGEPLSEPPDGWWVDPCFKKIHLPDNMIHKGPNEILLKTDFTEDKNIEAMYLVGDFGVKLSGHKASIVQLPKKLCLGDIVQQGLPFYSGTVSYELGSCDASSILVSGFSGACVRVRRGERNCMVAFAPYEASIPDGEEPLWLDVVLTRRNTFGPLHQLPGRTFAYSPGSFVSSGPSWTYDYVVLPAGLSGIPKVR